MRRLILVTVLTLGVTVARAESGLFYLGAGVTSNSLTTLQTNLNNKSWKAFAGVRPWKWVAVELDYIDLGSGDSTQFSNASYGTTHADGSAWAAYAVGFLPVSLPMVDFYGKAGVARWKLNSTIFFTYQFPPYDASTTSASSIGTDLAWGVGVQAHFSIVGVRLEYEGFNVNSNGAKVASLSAFLNF